MKYNGGYPLSLRDNCLAGHIPELIALGVSSLKLEGRLKPPEYVYAVTSAYRKLLDSGRIASPEEISALAKVFPRGFTTVLHVAYRFKDLGVRGDVLTTAMLTPAATFYLTKMLTRVMTYVPQRRHSV